MTRRRSSRSVERSACSRRASTQDGKRVTRISLAECLDEAMRSQQPLEEWFEAEREMGTQTVVETIHNVLSDYAPLVDLVAERLPGRPRTRCATSCCIMRTGALFPVYRTFSLLEQLKGRIAGASRPLLSRACSTAPPAFGSWVCSRPSTTTVPRSSEQESSSMAGTQAIKTLFASDIERRIEEVIKVDQTDEDHPARGDRRVRHHRRHPVPLRRRSSRPTPRRPNKPHEGIGVWVSGFFGSGKSSFAKMLGLAIENRVLAGDPAVEALRGARRRQQAHGPARRRSARRSRPTP